jgi:hypothetical protein
MMDDIILASTVESEHIEDRLLRWRVTLIEEFVLIEEIIIINELVFELLNNMRAFLLSLTREVAADIIDKAHVGDGLRAVRVIISAFPI